MRHFSKSHCPSLSKYLASFAMLMSVVAQAQTSYSVTVLKPLTTGVTLDTVTRPWAIDSAEVVVSEGWQFGAFEQLLYKAGLKGISTRYAVKWPASTATSVAPRKIYASARSVLGVAKGGTKLLVNYDRQGNFFGVLDTRTGALSGTAGMPMFAEVINDAGMVGWSDNVGEGRHGTWSPGTGVITLTGVPANQTYLKAINQSGLLAGNAVRGANQGFLAQGGVAQYLEADDQHASVIVDLNNAGQALVQRFKTTGCVPLTSGCSSVPPGESGIWHNGSYTPLVSTMNGKYVVATGINHAGRVVGRAYDNPEQSQIEKTGSGRAVIWENGQPTDLTAWVNARGAGIKAGQYINRVVAMNDRGSLVGSLYDPVKNAEVVVRLTAKP